MKVRIALVLFFCLIASCGRRDDSPADPRSINGTWVGDFGPAFYDRNTISLELHWDGKELTGKILPGVQGGRMYRNFTGFSIENASFDPTTGAVRFEATYKPKERRYIIEGKLTKNALSGTWNRPGDNSDGDFKLTKKTE
jgi:hypothetical protein